MNFDPLPYLILFLAAFTLHEAGHAVYLTLSKIEYKNGFDHKGYFFKGRMTRRQSAECALIGIFSGLIPFLFFPWIVPALLYVAGCFSDLKLLTRLTKNE